MVPDALCIFHRHSHGPISNFLYPKFRHVFCAIKSGDYWIMFDPRNGIPVFEVVAPADYDLLSFYRLQGYHVVALSRRQVPVRGPLMAATCVGAVKSVCSAFARPGC